MHLLSLVAGATFFEVLGVVHFSLQGRQPRFLVPLEPNVAKELQYSRSAPVVVVVALEVGEALLEPVGAHNVVHLVQSEAIKVQHHCKAFYNTLPDVRVFAHRLYLVLLQSLRLSVAAHRRVWNQPQDVIAVALEAREIAGPVLVPPGRNGVSLRYNWTRWRIVSICEQLRILPPNL
jgi:hypothetical protein